MKEAWPPLAAPPCQASREKCKSFEIQPKAGKRCPSHLSSIILFWNFKVLFTCIFMAVIIPSYVMKDNIINIRTCTSGGALDAPSMQES